MAAPQMSVELMIETLKIYESSGRNSYESAKSINIPYTTFQSRLYKAKKKFPDGIPEVNAPIVGKWTYTRLVSIVEPSTRWIVGSDLHVWSGEPTIIYKAFCKVARDLKVDGIVMNGDIIDGARVSRHSQVRGSSAPKIHQEIETAREWFKLLPIAKHQLWSVGNHDIRIDAYLMANASELDGIVPTLQDYFKDWRFAYAFDVNGTEIRHRFRGGIHAGWNNALHSGVNMVTGHTHQLQVTAMRDRKGTRWGIETGTLADPFGPQFEYSEGTPSRSQMGFVVLTFDEQGTMLPPEICEMIGGRPVFRGAYVF